MYNRLKAVEYAYRWWDKRNPLFYNFDDLGGDCTNFVSQCLYFGGIPMNFAEMGWFYSNLNLRAPAWTGVDEFFSFATSNNSGTGVKVKQIIKNQIQIGDVIQLQLLGENEFHHSLFVTQIYNGEIFVTCHTADAKDRLLDLYNAEKIRYLKVLN